MKFFMSLKNKNEIILFMLNIFNLIANQSDNRLKFFRIDDVKKYRELISTFNVKNIFWKKSISYVQNQNDVVERFIKTMIERTRTLIIETNLSRSLWLEIIVIVCYLFNRLFIKTLTEKTSFEAWTDRKFDPSNLRVYNCDVYVIDYQVKTKEKMTSRMWVDTLIEYKMKNQWRIFDEKKIVIKQDVVFNENFIIYKSRSNFALNYQSVRENFFEFFRSMRDSEIIENNVENSTIETSLMIDIEIFLIEATKTFVAIFNQISTFADLSDINFEEYIIQNSIFIKTLTFEQLTWQIEKGDYKQLHRRDFVKAALSSHDIKTFDSWKEAMTSSQLAKWLQAVVKKINSQKTRKFSHFVIFSFCQFIFSDKWVFKLKKNFDDFIVKYKARWIIHDYTQIKDRDYDESYALVVRFNSSRILLAITTRKRWLIKQFDMTIVYLYEKMNRELYIEQLENFVKNENLVCKLNSNLYKLVQSEHLWFKEFNSSLKIFELTQFK